MSAQAYAKVVSYARNLLRLLLKPEALREAAEASSIQEAVASLPDTIYQGLKDAKTRADAERAIWGGYLRAVYKAVRLAPTHASRALSLFSLLEEARDALVLAEAVRSGRGPEALEGLPSAHVDQSPLSRLRGEVDALQSVQRLSETVGDKRISALLEEALSFEQKSGVRGTLMFYYAPFAAKAAGYAISSLPGGERGLYSRVVCPRVLYIVVSALVQAKERGLEARLVDEAFQGVSVCGFKWEDARGIYEREPDPQGLAASMAHLLPGWKTEGGVAEILESARRAYRFEARRRSSAAIAGYPFQAGFVAAVLELARLEAEDLVSVLTGIALRLKPEDYAPRLSLKIGVG